MKLEEVLSHSVKFIGTYSVSKKQTVLIMCGKCMW